MTNSADGRVTYSTGSMGGTRGGIEGGIPLQEASREAYTPVYTLSGCTMGVPLRVYLSPRVIP